MNYLEVKNLSKRYNDEVGFVVNLIEDTSFDVAGNTIVSILAPTGAGKSSILKIISGLEELTEGTITINSPNKKIVYIPSEPSSFPWYNVKENIELVRKDSISLDEVIKLVKLEGYEDHFPDNKSAGFRFRISLARAIAAGADIIVIDEPFKYMTAAARLRIYELLLGIKAQTKISFVLGSTNLSEAIFLSDRIYLMKKNPGKIIDSSDVVFDNKRNSDVMNTDKFIEYRNRIEKLLKSEKSQLLSDIVI